MKSLRYSVPVFLFATFLIASCSPVVRPEQPVYLVSSLMDEAQQIGQTFVANFDGLNGVELYLEPEVLSESELQLFLKDSPESTTELAVSTLPLHEVVAPGYYLFPLPVERDSYDRAYFFQLKLSGEGQIRVGTANGAAYLDGAFYQNGTPRDQQITFQLAYDPTNLIRGLVEESLIWLLWLFASFILLALPGWAIFSILYRDWDLLHWAEKIPLSIIAGLAFYPLLLIWTNLAGIKPGIFAAWLPSVFSLVYMLLSKRIALPYAMRRSKVSFTSAIHSQGFWHGITLLGILALVFLTRFYHVRTVEAPMWGDSVQHAEITQLILDNDGLFQSWQPYTPYDSLTIHFGFSVFSALLSWMTGASSTLTTLLSAQIVNGLACLSLYPLAVRLSGGNRWAGIAAVLFSGLLSPMPAFYVNWGRFAQLAGQAILPVALWLVWDLLDRPLPNRSDLWKMIFLAGFTLAGMVFFYFRMPFYYATFILALMLSWGSANWKTQWRKWVAAILKLLAVATVALLLFSPWIIRLQGSNLVSFVESGATSGTALDWLRQDFEAWKELSIYTPTTLFVLAILAGLWALIRRQWQIFALPIWFILLDLYLIGVLLRLPGANMLQNFALLIALYIPIGLLGGWLTGLIIQWIIQRYRAGFTVLVSLLLLAIGVYSAIDQRSIADPLTYSLVGRPDIRAMRWIEENTPADARFMVESVSIYDGTSAIGSDAGWWLPLLSSRASILPPQYAMLNEQPEITGYTQRVADLIRQLEITPPNTLTGLAALCSEKITHLYIGQQQGGVGYGARPLFTPTQLLSSEAFQAIYHQDRVYIFAVLPDACPNVQ